MKLSTLFKLLILPLIAIVLSLAMSTVTVWTAVGGVASIILPVLLFFIFRGFYLPYRAAERGIELLNSQSYNNKLCKVGEPGADRIVELFNRLSMHLREESIKVREQDKLLSNIIELSPVGIAMLDLGGRISTVNKAFADFCILPIAEIYGKETASINNDFVQFLLSMEDDEVRVLNTPFGEKLKCYSLYFMSYGFKRRFFMVESLSEELRLAEKSAYERVIRMISHEVNNTIVGVETVLETVNEEKGIDEAIRELAYSTLRRCEAMNEFITSFADLARLPEPKMKLRSLRDVLEQMLPFLNSMVGKTARIEFDSGEDAEVEIDESLFQQCVVNIVKNAVEAISEREERDSLFQGFGLIGISIVGEGDDIQLIISNNGVPISAESAEKLFTPFYSTKRAGRGLGLTLVSEIMHRHGARVSLQTLKNGLTLCSIAFRSSNR